MSPFSTASPEELAIMTEAFDAHCLQHNIVDHSAAREHAAHIVTMLFDRGAKTVEELRAGLDRLRKF